MSNFQLKQEEAKETTAREREMQQRRSESGRPSGTDGYDFSYRMVVDSRYQKVALKKKILSSLIIVQVILQFLGLPYIFLAATKNGSLDVIVVSSAAVGFISLILGELGRRRSRVNLLRLYIFGSSISLLLSVFGIIRSELTMEVIQNPSEWKITLEAPEAFRVAIGLLIQLFVISTTITLISNMSPPKRTT